MAWDDALWEMSGLERREKIKAMWLMCVRLQQRCERLEQTLKVILQQTIAFDQRFQQSESPEEYGTETIAEIGTIAEKALEEKT